MPAGVKPDDGTIRTLLKTHTHRQIADQYGVTRQAVGQWARSVGMSQRVSIYKDILPWEMRADDHRDHIARALRWHLKIQRGEPVTEAQVKEVRKLTDFLAEFNCVVDYDKTRGFLFRPRDPKVDAPDDLIRRPKETP